jgi:LuxR family transcriptional regulator, maltose regulon positive regulatory protein
LTEKEMEVLRHLAALLSTEEIARTLFVSVNTAKTHVRATPCRAAIGRTGGAARNAGDQTDAGNSPGPDDGAVGGRGTR